MLINQPQKCHLFFFLLYLGNVLIIPPRTSPPSLRRTGDFFLGLFCCRAVGARRRLPCRAEEFSAITFHTSLSGDWEGMWCISLLSLCQMSRSSVTSVDPSQAASVPKKAKISSTPLWPVDRKSIIFTLKEHKVWDTK